MLLTELMQNKTLYPVDITPISKADLKLCSHIPTIPADQLQVTEIEFGLARQVLFTTESSQLYFFKPRWDMRPSHFNREVSVLEAIRTHGLDRTLKVTQLEALVVDETGMVVGMLFKWLYGLPLAEERRVIDPVLQKRWREQVVATVEELHRHGILWGDVNVYNIFIDVEGDAWVIDFGGDHNYQFIDAEHNETREGDWQGVRKVFEGWIPARVENMSAKPWTIHFDGEGHGPYGKMELEQQPQQKE